MYKKREGTITYYYPKNDKKSEMFYTDEKAVDIDGKKTPYHIITPVLAKLYSDNCLALENDGASYIIQGQEISYFREDKAYPLYLDLIHPLIGFCEDKYKNTPCNENCDCKDTYMGGKTYGDQLDEVISKCDKRLKRIQTDDETDEVEDYNCKRLMYYYTLKYAPVYCSEMIEALAQAEKMAQEEYENNPNMELIYRDNRVLSLGCGNAVDLLAFEWFRTADILNIGKHPFKLEYCGLDKSDKWKNIQNYVKENCDADSEQVNFIRADLLSSFDCDNDMIPVDHYNFNVIILPYVNSLIYKLLESNEDRMREWYNKLIDKVIDPKKSGPVWVIINDTEVSDTYEWFIDALNDHGYKVRAKKYYFPHNTNYIYDDTYIEYTNDNIEYCTLTEDYYGNFRFTGVFDDIVENKNGDYNGKRNYQQLYSAMRYLQATQLIVEVEES